MVYRFFMAPGLASAPMASYQKLFDRGIRCQESHDFAGAETLYRRILRARPRNVATLNNLAVVLKERGAVEEAGRLLRRALALRPDYADAHLNLGTVHEASGRLEEAAACYRAALARAPGHGDAETNLGGVLRTLGRHDQAVAHYRDRLAHDPGSRPALVGLADALAVEGRIEEADAAYARALAATPPRRRMRSQSSARSCCRRSIARMRTSRNGAPNAWPISIAFSPRRAGSPIRCAMWPRCRSISPIRATTMPPRRRSSRRSSAAPPHHCRWGRPERFPPRGPAGSACSRAGGTATRSACCYLRTAGTLAEAGLAVTVLDGRPAPGGLERMPQGVEYRPLPRNLAAATAALAEAALDVLLFTDMGMDTFAYFLALGRHAPVQCVLNGHPITTGLPEIDYFISFRAVGGAGFEERYTERLMLLDWYPGIFARPPVPPAPLGRAALGLPVEGRLYVCPMTLYKIHPDFDSALAGILASDQEARVVLFRDRHAASLHEVLAGRFRDTLGADAGRVIFLPYATPEAFMSVMMHAAAVLDSFPFGGTTTSLIALASGTPVVTRLGTLARGRFTAGYYRAIGVEDCIAHSLDAYVALAVRLGTEPDFRAAVSARIRDRVAVLYDNPAGARALADFLASLAPRAAA